jgi:hypothetical protein
VSDAAPSAAGPGDTAEPIDRAAALRGAGAALIFAVPAGFASRVVSEGSSLKGLFLLVTLLGFGWGGAVAAKAGPPRRPLTSGAVAGIVAVVAYDAIGIVDHLIRGGSIGAVALAFTALLGVSCGILGAELGSRRRRARATSDDDDD